MWATKAQREMRGREDMQGRECDNFQANEWLKLATKMAIKLAADNLWLVYTENLKMISWITESCLMLAEMHDACLLFWKGLKYVDIQMTHFRNLFSHFSKKSCSFICCLERSSDGLFWFGSTNGAMYLPIQWHFLGAEPMEPMESILPLCHDLTIISIALQLMLIAVLLLYKISQPFFKWRQGVAFSATLVPTLEQLLPLPPPGPVLMWAVEWDLDIRAMVDDLKREGPLVVERYCQNEAFMLKLRKIVRNVVSQSEMIRITQEVRMRRELEKFQRVNFQKSIEEEDEDAKAWQAMMKEMTGETPLGAQPVDVNVGAPMSQLQPPAPAPAFEGDDAAAWEAMMSVMNRKPFEDMPSPTPEPLPVPVAPPAAPTFEGDDAAAWEAMMSVMNRKPFEDMPSPTPEPLPVPVAPPAAPTFEGDDAAAWEAMMSVMNRKPFEDMPSPTPEPLPVPVAPPAAPTFEGDDAAAWEAMMSVMNRKPFEDMPSPTPEPLPVPVAPPAAPTFEGDDAAAWEAMMSSMNGKPVEDMPSPMSDCSTEHVQVQKSESEQSGDTAVLWAQMEEMENQGATLEEQALKFVSLCMPSKSKCQSHDEKLASTTHFFIGETDDFDFEDDQFDSFWSTLDQDLCQGAEMMPQVQKLLDCFVPKVPTLDDQQHFYIGDEVEVFQRTATQEFYIGDEDVPEMSLPWQADTAMLADQLPKK